MHFNMTRIVSYDNIKWIHVNKHRSVKQCVSTVITISV